MDVQDIAEEDLLEVGALLILEVALRLVNFDGAVLEVYCEIALRELAPLKDLVLMHALPQVSSHNVLLEYCILKSPMIETPQLFVRFFHSLIVPEVLF